MNAEEIANRLQHIKPLIKQACYDTELFAANQIGAKMIRRIFNDGGAYIGKIGNYKPLKTKNRDSTLKKLNRAKKRAALIGGRNNLSPYEKYRVKLGRQIGYKDLEVTGSLKSALQVGTRNGRPVFGIAGQKYADIAKGQEEQTKKLIFVARPEEKKEVNDEAIEFLRDRAGQIFKSIFPVT